MLNAKAYPSTVIQMRLPTVRTQEHVQATRQLKLVLEKQAVQVLEHVYGTLVYVEIKSVQKPIRH